MIVFLYILLILVILFIILSLSNITIKICNMTIDDIENVEDIIKILLKEKNERNKINVLNYISFELKIQIKFLNKIPIFYLKLNNEKIKRLLLKQYDKEVRKNKDIEQDKKKAKAFSKKILPNLILENTNLYMTLGTDNAAFTALASSIINMTIAIILPYVTDVNSSNKLDNYYYKVNPIYLNKNVFFLQFSCIITVKLVHIINVICKKEEKKE